MQVFAAWAGLVFGVLHVCAGVFSAEDQTEDKNSPHIQSSLWETWDGRIQGGAKAGDTPI